MVKTRYKCIKDVKIHNEDKASFKAGKIYTAKSFGSCGEIGPFTRMSTGLFGKSYLISNKVVSESFEQL